MSFVAVGYLSGIVHKLLYSCDYLIIISVFNLMMILIDLYLYTRYNLGETDLPIHFATSLE